MTPRVIDSQSSIEVKMSDENKQRALLVARLEQDQRQKERLDAETTVKPTSYSPLGKKWSPSSTVGAPAGSGPVTSTPSSTTTRKLEDESNPKAVADSPFGKQWSPNTVAAPAIPYRETQQGPASVSVPVTEGKREPRASEAAEEIVAETAKAEILAVTVDFSVDAAPAGIGPTSHLVRSLEEVGRFSELFSARSSSSLLRFAAVGPASGPGKRGYVTSSTAALEQPGQTGVLTADGSLNVGSRTGVGNLPVKGGLFRSRLTLAMISRLEVYWLLPLLPAIPPLLVMMLRIPLPIPRILEMLSGGCYSKL
jgi:hypothetical protein